MHSAYPSPSLVFEQLAAAASSGPLAGLWIAPATAVCYGQKVVFRGFFGGVGPRIEALPVPAGRRMGAHGRNPSEDRGWWCSANPLKLKQFQVFAGPEESAMAFFLARPTRKM